MSEETKQPTQEEEAVTGQEPAAEETAPETEATAVGKAKKEKKKKEKTYTLTREQMEAAELAAKQLASVTDQYTRLAAEYDNYRKRTAKEKETIYQDAKMDTIQAFLAVYDNLERAVKSGGDDDSPHKKGLEMIFQQYRDVLGKMGVTEMEALGQPFDPNRHNAVMHVDDDRFGENEICDVFQAGFMLGDRVLRFAVVRVAN